MQDIINSFKAHLYERTSSPLIGAFIFYWIVCNYKLVIVLFSSYEPKEMFQIIKNLYPQEKISLWTGFDIHYYTLLGNGLLIPLLITLAYIFIIPYPAKLIYSFWKNRQKELITIKHSIEDGTIIGEEQSRNLRNTLYTLQKKYDSQFEEITNLKSLINSTDTIPNIKENIPIKKVIEKETDIETTALSDNKIKVAISNYKTILINSDEFKILQKIKTTKECRIEDIHDVIFKTSDLEYYTQKLSDDKLINYDNNLDIFTLTKKGDRAIEKYKKDDEIPF